LMNPMLLPSIDFPWVSSSYVNQCRDERAHGRGITIATGHQTGAMPMEAAEGRKCEGGAGNGFGSRVVHDTNLRSVGEQNRCQVEIGRVLCRESMWYRADIGSFYQHNGQIWGI